MVQEIDRSTAETLYEKWMRQEGLPVHEALGGMGDVTQLDRKPWARTGGSACFIQMLGTIQAGRGIYVGEIPGGGTWNPERHLFDEAFFIIQGRGLTEVWQEGQSKVTFEWGPGSVFAPPLNTWHRLVNGSREPALFVAITTAPQVMSALFDYDYLFSCDHNFVDFFGEGSEYFSPGEKREQIGRGSTKWTTNFIPDASAAFLDDWEHKVSGGQLTGYRMARNFPRGHISEWPVGRYHKAHYHDGGALVMGLQGEGYVTLWPNELGIHPYQDGHGDEVHVIEWGPHSIYIPPDGWFHQHMNTGKGPARHIACYPGRGEGERVEDGLSHTVTPIREGGALIDYEEEDPEIRRRFEATLRAKGIESTMPPVTYRQ